MVSVERPAFGKGLKKNTACSTPWTIKRGNGNSSIYRRCSYWILLKPPFLVDFHMDFPIASLDYGEPLTQDALVKQDPSRPSLEPRSISGWIWQTSLRCRCARIRLAKNAPAARDVFPWFLFGVKIGEPMDPQPYLSTPKPKPQGLRTSSHVIQRGCAPPDTPKNKHPARPSGRPPKVPGRKREPSTSPARCWTSPIFFGLLDSIYPCG